ncbi:L,D-transpeptidase/peptidoglycan binding protein [Sporolactobacillus sp. CPB3-1]|uniref:L,D-transpeptidase/peptidoglycan binding protein n=1 Tax=Sporolactobacillus mangiferae TaxID=2940498 RepID=A0ABT0M676_9BACL|nr:L,D-transpeptidase/peptidoglycan binding protein [Sporolactobacillus mangiferae]
MISYIQANRFNAHITINGVNVGHLTPEQALAKLSGQTLKNDVYIGKKRVVNGKNLKSEFGSEDLPAVKRIFQKQRTWLPSSTRQTYTLNPRSEGSYRSQTLKKLLENELNRLNKHLKAPKDAYAYLENGKIGVSKSEPGKKYDIKKMMHAYDQQEYNSEIHLDESLLVPIKADSKTVKHEISALKSLMTRTINYKVQDKTYALKADELIKKATASSDQKIRIDSNELKARISEINKNQSTLNKKFSFRTHTGKVISVQGQSYGWALNVSKETERIEKAFEQGKTDIKAYNVYGVGYSTYGIGYHNTTNHGIGNTYAEVSISEQKIWIYKNGKLVVSTHVVTGRHDTNEDTPKGLWYIMYKESPSTLEGSEAGNPNYSVKVNYWAPFTMSGCGFHDAKWRKNWKKTAYLTHGSGGCVNTPPGIMKQVYDNLDQNEPVIIY